MKKEISRMEAMNLIKSGKTVSCQIRTGEFSQLATMEDLIKVVNLEQRLLTEKLRFFETEN